MVKIIASILIVFGTVIFGIKKSDELKKRQNWLEGFKTAINFIKEEIRYTYIPIPQLLNKITKFEQFKELLIFDNCVEELSNEKKFNIAWKKALDKTIANIKLLNDDIYLAIAFGEGFGKSDIENQLSLCERTCTLLDSNIENAKGRYEKYSRLYKMLGLFAGIVVVIFII